MLLPVMASAAIPGHVEHVLLISVDGMHAVDLARFIDRHPQSTLAGLARHGIRYAGAETVVPADSFPGLLALTTGGTPAVTGVYYDDTFDRKLSPAGSDCSRNGAAVVYDESVDGPESQEGKPMLNEKLLPRDPKGCKPVYPHDYLRVNTVFEVIHQSGGYTAWIDKHPVYEILNGPSGKGLDDLFTPEIGSNSEGPQDVDTDKITGSIRKTERYDELKADALVNELNGFRHDGKTPAPVPSISGFNIQAVNVAEKLAGYKNAQGEPSSGLENALTNSDRLIGKIVSALANKGLMDSTAIIVTAKHGNGPVDPRALRRIDKQMLTDVVQKAALGALAHITVDQGSLIWLKDPTRTIDVARALKRSRKQLGIQRVLYGSSLAKYFPSPLDDSRTPDLIVIPHDGVIYAAPSDRKKAEHGGFLADDTSVALLISNPQLERSGEIVRTPVSTTQVAPTILALLGLAPQSLESVAMQGTKVLPGVKR